MNILIVGDGKVGFSLARQLNKEGHAITVIENKPKVLENTINAIDVVGVVGNGASPETLKDAHIEDTDLLIAATSTDEINMICCLLGKKLGAKHTIARIRTPEYSKALEVIKEEIGLSLQINPELEAAREIRRNLRFTSTMKVTSFAKGRMELAEVKIFPDSPLVGMSVASINSKYKEKVLFCAIQRGKEIIIPNGSTRIQANDKVSLTGRTKQLQQFFSSLKLLKQKKLREVMIIGGGRIAYYLTPMLLELGMDVKIIERNREKCLQFVEKFPQATIIQGDGTDHDLLLSEALEEMDAFIALTDNDEENVIISMFASSKGVPCILPKVNRVPLSFLLEKLGLENAITPKNITANQIIQYVRAMQNSLGSNVESLLKILEDEVEVLEFRIRDNCKFIGSSLKEISFKPDVLVAYITHNGIPQIATGNSKPQIGDTFIVITKLKGLRDVNDIIN